MPRWPALLLVVAAAAAGCSARGNATAPVAADAKPTPIPPPDASGAIALLEEVGALAHAALTGQALPRGKLPLRPDEGKELVNRLAVGPPPAGSIRRLYVVANAYLGYAKPGALYTRVLIGPTGFRVGYAAFQGLGPDEYSKAPSMAGLQASLASISWALKGGWGTVPWFVDADAAACGALVGACTGLVEDASEADRAGDAEAIGQAGAPDRIHVSKLVSVEVTEDGRVFYVQVRLAKDLSSVRQIDVDEIAWDPNKPIAHSRRLGNFCGTGQD